jgi:hypothetical protein
MYEGRKHDGTGKVVREAIVRDSSTCVQDASAWAQAPTTCVRDPSTCVRDRER